MTDLFLAEDVELRLGRSFTASENLRISSLITDASASIRNYMRQEVTAATTTVLLRVRGGKIRLPQRPVTAVSAVVNDNGDPVLYQWWGDDTVWVGSNVPDSFAWEPWRNGYIALTVTYDHGSDPVPDDIVGVGCSIVTRALGREPADAGITSESIAGYSYSLGSAAAAGAFGMLQAERDILDTYKRVGGVINTAPAWITP